MKRRKQEFYEAVVKHPIIAAVKDEKGLQTCIRLQEIGVVFVLYGGISNIGDIVKRLKEAGKTVIVHMDLIMGLSAKEEAVVFIAKYTQADGIISTKPAVIKRGKELGMFTVLRFFVLDSLALENVMKQDGANADMIEILPGIMPKVTKRETQTISIPVICGGLISDKEDIIGALNAGAVAVSTTNPAAWIL